MASAAQWERRIIGSRTREALEAKRASGVRLGRPSRIHPAVRLRIKTMRDAGQTLQSIADDLNGVGVPTARGAAQWRTSSVSAALQVMHHDKVAEEASNSRSTSLAV